MNIGGCCKLGYGKTRDTVHENMVFVAPIESIILLVSFVRSSMYTEFTVLISLREIIGLELVFNKRLRIVLRSIGGNGSGIQSDKRRVNNGFVGKERNLRLHDIGKDIVVKVFKEAIKSPVGGKRQSDVKTAEKGNEKVIVKIIKKLRNHRKAFAFHDNEGTDHGMV